jgi:hypothetical protein
MAERYGPGMPVPERPVRRPKGSVWPFATNIAAAEVDVALSVICHLERTGLRCRQAAGRRRRQAARDAYREPVAEDWPTKAPGVVRTVDAS